MFEIIPSVRDLTLLTLLSILNLISTDPTLVLHIMQHGSLRTHMQTKIIHVLSIIERHHGSQTSMSMFFTRNHGLPTVRVKLSNILIRDSNFRNHCGSFDIYLQER
jgi:hypothetical protein